MPNIDGNMTIPRLYMSGTPSLLTSSFPSPPVLTDQYVMSAASAVHHHACITDAAGLRVGRMQADEGVVIRSDMATVSMGYGVVLRPYVIIRPPLRPLRGGKALEAVAVTWGSYILVGANSVVCASQVGNFVVIGEDSVVGDRAVLGEGCWIRPRSVVPAGTVAAPYGVYEGDPAVFVGLLNDNVHSLQVRETVAQAMFVVESPPKK